MKTKLRFLVVLGFILIFSGFSTFSQVGINTDGSQPDSSAMLDVKSESKGMLIPRMTQEEITSITNPANGLQVFCTTDSKLYIFLLSFNRWKEVAFGSGEYILPATFSIGTGGACANTVVNGTYYPAVSLTTSSFVTIQVNVSVIGTYSITTNPFNGYSFNASGEFSTTGSQTVNLMGNGTPVIAQTDQFTATASNNGGICTFSVLVWTPCPDIPTISYGGQIYNTVQIGTQCWLKENLNIGTRINGTTYQSNNSIIEKHCYNDIEDSCTVYGGLYEWNETMQYITTEGPQGICPSGFHIPSATQWDVLRDYLGGQTVAGGKMKETGMRYWQSPNTGATNSSGFSDRGAGTYRPSPYNYYYLLYQAGIFWTSTMNGSSVVWRRDTDYLGTGLWPYSCYKTESFPVRCIKD